MGILSYIIPQEWVLRIIIIAMIALAVFVIRKCWILSTLGKENLAMLDRMENVGDLEKALLKNDANLDQEFAKYETALGKNDNTSVLFEHLKAIYDAGAQSSRLDADLLVKNTVDKIFTDVDSIKTSISLFLVIGILGTLAGLAISIGGFNGANFVMTGQNSSTADELSLLFGNLRGAFAPSMWGVFFTIVFVFGYSWKIQEGCINKVTEKLTINTIRYWLPKLYPTDFQRGDQSLVKLNATIANADGINNGVRTLEKNLSSSNQTLRQLAKVSDDIQKASDRFDKSTDKIVKIKELYDELKKTNDIFHSSLESLINSAIQDRKDSYKEYIEIVEKNYAAVQDANQKMKDQMGQYFDALTEVLKKQNSAFSAGLQGQIDTWKATLNNQNAQLQEVISQLKAYDTSFFQTVNESRESLNKSIEVNRNAAIVNQELGKKLHEIEEKLLSRQDELMVQISQPITSQLSGVAQALQHIQQPLNEAVKNIEKMANYNQRQTSETMETLKVMTDKLQEKQDSLAHNEQELMQMLESLQKTVQGFQGAVNTTMAVVGEKSGVSPELIKQCFEAQTAALRTSNSRREKDKEEKKNGFLSLKNVPVLVIAVLLLFSVVTQIIMVTKISALEQNQAAVNQVLMKGEMNDSSSASGQ
ncbi:putative uncharacterized protein [Megasphaera elsdenii CAG:570]|uniref:MotA/TolQ/ExbB proton channel domain-containing protein n=1 Tax=Megasphaera elsdenii CAG:570 TaxID=1263087 RepID=R7MYX3_MEGEL|nr:putative uncharacterized protein [Megasphaera elsdenii CAG:570]